MRRKVLLYSFVPLGIIAVFAIVVVLVRGSEWAGQKCEDSVGYAETGYEVGSSVSDDEKMFLTCTYLDAEQFVEFQVDSGFLEGDGIKLVISYAGKDEEAALQMGENARYTVVDEYEIEDVGHYSFAAHDIVDGWYWVMVVPEADTVRASGTLKLCIYDNNWNHFLNQIR